MALFESYERREKQILAVLAPYGINTIEECADVCKEKGLDIYKLIESIQPICFENAKWAYTVGAAIAIKSGCTKAADAAAAIGIGLQAFCIPGSVAENRKVGLGHGNLGKGARSMVGTMYGTKEKGVRYLEMTEGYCTRMALDENNEVCGYEFVSLGKMTDFIKKGMEPNEAYEQSKGTYGRFKPEDGVVKYIDPRKE